MRDLHIRSLVLSIAWLMALSGRSAAEGPASAELPQPIYSRQTRFSIPFQIARPRSPMERPAGVQLHVSTDRGTSWQRHAEADPDAGHFDFEAPEDGEYWFFVRTRDQQGRLLPARPATPELRVIVDTEEPEVELSAWRGLSGEVTVRWRIVEPNVDPRSLVLEYRPAGTSGNWERIATGPMDTTESTREYTGELTFVPAVDEETLVVRVQVRDRAGNPAVSQCRTTRDDSNVATARPDNNVATSPAEGTDESKVAASRSDSSGDSKLSPQAWEAERTAAAPKSEATGAESPSAKPAPKADEAEPSADSLAQATTEAAPRDPFERDRSPRSDDVKPDADHVTDRAPIATEVRDERTQPPSPAPARSDTQPLPSRIHPPVADRFPRDDRASLWDESDPLRPGEFPRMVNSLRFAVDYVIEPHASGPRPIVELWGTRDGGRTWSRYGTDPDGKSPIELTVPEEGLYGLKLLVHRSGQPSQKPPARGDRPDVWVGVDVTAPTARLLGVSVDEENHEGEVTITWEADDWQLAANPITLLVRSRAIGTWNVIAAGLPNTGRYIWRPEPDLPDRVFLRLEARDEAGNVQVAVEPEAIELPRERQPYRIRNVRGVPAAAGNAAQQMILIR